VPFGVFSTWWGPPLAFLVQLPLGLAFAAAVYTVTVTTLSEAAMGALFRLVMMPLFLFSGAFFPVENLPTAMEWLARVTPLWQGVSLTRMISTGQVDALPALGHLAYLLAMCAVGVWLAVRALERRLLV
jgi:lipooligosaccharide transport system permease protein